MLCPAKTCARVLGLALLATTAVTARAAERQNYVSRQVTFTEINLNWFGLGGSPDGTSEPRVASVKAYLHDHGLLANVLVFEEIVDLGVLQSQVLDDAYECHSYQRDDAKHQHVVICVDADHKLEVADDADGYALEEVDVTGHLRPAVHGVVETKDGTRLAHVFGVHLKATPTGAATRKKQVAALEAYLVQEKEPLVVMGDFNTYDNDPADFQRVFAGAGLAELATTEPYTWASATEHFAPAKFDRIWVTKGLLGKVAADAIVGPCSSGDDGLIATYNEQVSDHCFTTVTLAL